jgi:hypothetical protein
MGDEQFALDSVSDAKLNADRPGVRLARFAPTPAIVGGYWFMNERGVLWVFRHDGLWGRSYEFAVRGDSLVGRAFVRTDVPDARDEPTRAVALRTLTCRVGPRSDPPAASPPVASEGAGRRPGRPYTIDDRFADLARAVPGGFGGLWLEGSVLHVNLVELSKREQAQSALKVELRGEFGPGAATGQRASVDLDRIVFHQGRYDYLQLTGWYARLPASLGYDGVTSTDIDERRNRIRIGVRDDASAERVRRRIAELGIPSEAVLVQREEPARIREWSAPPRRVVAGSKPHYDSFPPRNGAVNTRSGCNGADVRRGVTCIAHKHFPTTIGRISHEHRNEDVLPLPLPSDRPARRRGAGGRAREHRPGGASVHSDRARHRRHGMEGGAGDRLHLLRAGELAPRRTRARRRGRAHLARGRRRGEVGNR